MNDAAPIQTSTPLPRPGKGTGRAFLSGAAANLVAGLLSLVLAPFLGVPSPPQLIQERLTALLPLSVTSGAIGLLGEAAKPVVLGLIALGWVLAGGVVGVVANRLRRPGWAYPLLLGLALWGAALVVLLPAQGQGLLGASAPSGPIRASLLWLILATAYLLALEAMAVQPSDRPETAPTPADRARRRLVRRLALGVAGAIAAAALGRWLWAITRLPQQVARGDGQLPPVVTPTQDFYTVSKNFVDPRVDEASWQLEVTGLVERPFSMSYQELLALESTRQYLTLECISNEVGGPLMGNAMWEGVRLADLLRRAGVKPGARKVVLTGEDDYSDSFPLEKALEPGTLLAHRMNGEPLTHSHGFPLRALVPGIYGMKNVKWLKQIELVDYDFQGFWQQREWSDQAVIQTTSRIDLPLSGDYRPEEVTAVGGVAFAGDRSISRVEVSMDGGRTWQPAQVRPALSPYTWVLWLIEWSPRPGRYEVLVRAADGKGELQTAEEREPLPDGASGYHRMAIEILSR